MTEVDLSAPLPAIQIDGETWEALIEMRVGPPRTMTLAHLVQVLAALPDDQRREVIGKALGITGLGGFECDPRDSASLEELRGVIDEELGWHTPEEEDAADYVANVKRTATDLIQLDAARREEKARADRAEQFIRATSAEWRRGLRAREHGDVLAVRLVQAVDAFAKELEPK